MSTWTFFPPRRSTTDSRPPRRRASRRSRRSGGANDRTPTQCGRGRSGAQSARLHRSELHNAVSTSLPVDGGIQGRSVPGGQRSRRPRRRRGRGGLRFGEPGQPRSMALAVSREVRTRAAERRHDMPGASGLSLPAEWVRSGVPMSRACCEPPVRRRPYRASCPCFPTRCPTASALGQALQIVGSSGPECGAPERQTFVLTGLSPGESDRQTCSALGRGNQARRGCVPLGTIEAWFADN